MPVTENRYHDAAAAATALARFVAADLRAGLAERGMASLVVSGGKSPIPFFQMLRREAMDWGHVTVTLADERWVETSSEQSNEHLVRTNLLLERAAVARFVGLKNAALTPAEGVASTKGGLVLIKRPFDAVVLGMGEDGHTASLFPGTPGLDLLLNCDAGAPVAATVAPVEPTARITMGAKLLLDARRIYLAIAGETKRDVYTQARRGASSSRYPIAAFLRQDRVPVTVLMS